MSQKCFSLILGGGAARGIAHIWVIRNLENSSYTPSLIVWTSIGAIIGAFYACGYTSNQMEKIIHEVNFLKLIDIDLRNWGIKWKKIMQFLEKHLGMTTFAETKIPLKLIATNIDTGEKIVFQEWLIVDAIRASISIPGIFSPFLYKNMRLVDWGISANLAIEEAPLEYPVVAVSVQVPEIIQKKHFLSPLFENGFFSNTYINLRKTIQIMMINNERNSVAKNPNILFLKIDKSDIDYYNFNKITELIEEWIQVSKNIPAYLRSYE